MADVVVISSQISQVSVSVVVGFRLTNLGLIKDVR